VGPNSIRIFSFDLKKFSMKILLENYRWEALDEWGSAAHSKFCGFLIQKN
jgi:hypothetical protein